MPRVQDLSLSSHRGEWQEVPRASENTSCIRQGPRESDRYNLQLSHMHGLRKEKQGCSQPPDMPAPCHVSEQPGLHVVLGSVVEKNFSLYPDGSREEGNHMSAGPLKS